MRRTILKASSLIYPWKLLGTKNLPMGKFDLKLDPNNNGFRSRLNKDWKGYVELRTRKKI
jgi:hypothetical protein